MTRYMSLAFVIIMLSAGLYWYAYSSGVENEQNRNELKWAKQVALTIKSNELMRQHLHDLSETHTQETFDAQQNIDDLLGSISNGDKRVFVRAKTSCPVPSDPNSKTRSNDEVPRAELLPANIRSIAKIGAECDQLAIDFNYLKNLYVDLLERQKKEMSQEER